MGNELEIELEDENINIKIEQSEKIGGEGTNINIEEIEKIIDNKLQAEKDQIEKDILEKIKTEITDKTENYSTEEKVIGKWIDGKPIYRKVMIKDGPFQIGEQVIYHDIENIDKVINVSGMARRADGLDQPLPTTFFNNIDWDVSIFDVGKNRYSLCLGKLQVTRLQITQLNIILEYTKTTD